MKKTTLISLAATLILVAPLFATEHTLDLDPAATKVSFDLPATGHDVHGLLHLTHGEITFDSDSGMAHGTIEIDIKTAETGNKRRDRQMHADVLESEEFPFAVFTAERIEGALQPMGESNLKLIGTIRLHGADHPLVLPATVTSDGTTLEAVTDFSIPFVAWGMEDPSIVFLRVAKEVQVHVTAVGKLREATAEAAKLGR